MVESPNVLGERLRLTLQLHEDGVRLMRQNLRRRDPGATTEEIDRRLRDWLSQRPGAELGDAQGRPVTWPRLVAGYDESVSSASSPDDALMRLGSRERRWVESLRDQLRALLGSRLRDLRLFGSHARGESGPESDIDLLVLVDGLDEETWMSVLDTAHSISPWLSPMIEDFQRYHAPRSRATGIYQEIRRDSARL
jgi:predicted nucleotidyltransferase